MPDLPQDVIKTAAPVSVSLIGAGAWARTAHLAGLALRDDIVFDSVYDPQTDRAAATAEEFGFAHVASSVDELLSRRAHACIIASPASEHASQALAALAAGKHVLLEKPMTNSAETAWQVADFAAAQDLTVMLALGWNYSPVFLAAKDLLAHGSIGVLEHATLQMASGTHALLAGESNDSSSRQDRPALSATWTDPALSGGGYGNAQLSHALGLLFGLVNESVSNIAAVVRPGPIPGIELSLAVSAVLESGATLSIAGTSIRQPIRQQLELRLFGAKGQVHIDFLRDRVARTEMDGSETVVELAPGAGEYPGKAPANAFIDVLVETSAINSSNAIVGARSTEVLDAVRAAS